MEPSLRPIGTPRGRALERQPASTSASASATSPPSTTIDLEIGQGEFFTLLGPSGCGKTTTLRMIAGFEEPDAGEILIDGSDVSGLPAAQAADQHGLPELRALPAPERRATTSPTASSARASSRLEVDKRVQAELERVGLWGEANRRPNQLSGGQQQRVALARAVVNLPKVLLLDEPLGALDLKLRKNLQIELKRIQQDIGITFVYVTHDQEEALTMSDRIAVMNRGIVEQVAGPEDVYERPATTFVAGFIGVSNLMPGTVRSLNGDKATVELEAGVTVEAEANGLSTGERCHAVVRPGEAQRERHRQRRRRRSPTAARASRGTSRAPSTSGPRPSSWSSSRAARG